MLAQTFINMKKHILNLSTLRNGQFYGSAAATGTQQEIADVAPPNNANRARVKTFQPDANGKVIIPRSEKVRLGGKPALPYAPDKVGQIVIVEVLPAPLTKSTVPDAQGEYKVYQPVRLSEPFLGTVDARVGVNEFMGTLVADGIELHHAPGTLIQCVYGIWKFEPTADRPNGGQGGWLNPFAEV